MRTAEFRELEVVGRDVNVNATGTLALNDTDQSNLTLHADTPSLEEVGKIVGAPLTGIAKVDATITGNRSELQANGTLVGSGVTYQRERRVVDDDDLRRARSRVLVRPRSRRREDRCDLRHRRRAERQRAHGDDQVRGASASSSTRSARQPERTLMPPAGWRCTPNTRKSISQRLALDTRGQQWQLAPGSEATVRYGGDAIAVDNVQLASGDQRLTAEGAFGRPGDALHVTLANVDLAGVDALLLREPQLSGRLNASADVTGTRQEPKVEGTFDVAQGGFRQFKYDALTGTLTYAGRGVTVDARLQENPTQWITAKRLPARRAVQQQRT